MIDLIINNIIGVLEFVSKTLLPLFIILYGWVKWGQYWSRKFQKPFEDVVSQSSLQNEGTLRHRLLCILLPLIVMFIFLIDAWLLLSCVVHMNNASTIYCLCFLKI